MGTKVFSTIAILALGLALSAMLFLRPAGFSQTVPVPDETGWDAAGLAYRQVGATVTTSDGSTSYSLTLIGPIRRVLAPWLRVSFGPDRVKLLPLKSRSAIGVPIGAHVAWCTEEGPWQFSEVPLPTLSDVPHRRPIHVSESIFTRLTRCLPGEAERLAQLATTFDTGPPVTGVSSTRASREEPK